MVLRQLVLMGISTLNTLTKRRLFLPRLVTMWPPMSNLLVEQISIALVLQLRKQHAQLASQVPSPNSSALWAVSLMTLELAAQQASSAQKPPTMTPFYAIQEL